MSKQYDGFLIQPMPGFLPDDSKWSVHVAVLDMRGRGDFVIRRRQDSRKCDSWEEAQRYSIQYGRDLIDGRVPGVPAMH